VRDYKAGPRTVEAIDAVHANDDYIFNAINETGCLNPKDKSETNIGLGGRPPQATRVPTTSTRCATPSATPDSSSCP
jgi:hypothetical protein